MKEHTIWTIGHSTRSLEEFVELLKSFNIELLVDIRRFPGSNSYPHFNKDKLEKSMKEHDLEYIHLEDLGGRRKVQPNSQNNAWRLASFQGYADYMETEEFVSELNQLKELATKKSTVIMCAEAVWWSCHRSLVADYLKLEGWNVMHIMGLGKSTEHPYTQPARIEDGKLTYSTP
ncbi:MAG TPA: DUF488 domain-containing protein [Brumimicrobium sp.]|nr:DUF488 domain-containing protein [Brumimicrobium sp.]